MRRILSIFFVALALASAAPESADAIIGRPLTPLSYAGVARRTARRSYRRGAYMGGGYGYGGYGGYGATPYLPSLPPGCAPGVPCGGATYEPAYQGPTVVYVER